MKVVEKVEEASLHLSHIGNVCKERVLQGRRLDNFAGPCWLWGPGLLPVRSCKQNASQIRPLVSRFHAESFKVTHLVILGGAATVVKASFGCPGAPIDLLYLFLFLGEGGCGRPREKVALLLAGRTESFLGLMGGGGG